MSNLREGTRVVRRPFGRIKDVVPVPNLIEIQSRSFNDFAQFDCLPAERKNIGLEKVFRDIFPIQHGDRMSLEYVSYELGDWSCTCGKLTGIAQRYTWSCSSCKASGCSRLSDTLECPSCKKRTAKYKTCPNCLSRVMIKVPLTLSECRSSEQSFAMPLKVAMQLVSWDVSEETGERSVRDVKEQDIFFADIPVMTDLYEEDGRWKLGSLGTFIINGVERVIVSQLHRSPGVVFSYSKKSKDLQGKPSYLARIIPARGAWMDFEFDSNDYLYVRIDKKKKFLVTTFLQALGVSRKDIIPLFYASDTIIASKGEFYQDVNTKLLGVRLKPGMVDVEDGGLYVGRPVTKETLAWLKKSGIKRLQVPLDQLYNRVFAQDVIDPDTGEILAEQGQPFSQAHELLFGDHKNLPFELIVSAGYVAQHIIPATLNQDKNATQEEALRDLHAKVWPGDGASLREVRERLENVFFGERLYDLTKVGRIRMNRKLGLAIDESNTSLTREDIFATIRYLVSLRESGEGEVDDIDHLGNRRVRLVGELLANQVYSGLLRVERIVKERFRIQEMHGAQTPQDFLNVKPLNGVIREFFGTGQLSQFIDQTNPLSEIAHKRRLSALGPGGVTKDRATTEVRDVHISHYGRICPIETPEGQTIGLISSLATYALVNDLGFIETAYRPVESSKVQEEVVFLDAFAESDAYIAQSDVMKKGSTLPKQPIFVRHNGNFLYTTADRVNYVDLSPKQLVSVATALIPFLEHDDASRALMGANMQRQAVPLVRTQVPIVATGMESEIARASGACVMARRPGVVEYVSSEKIVVRADESAFGNIDDWIAFGVDTYKLRKFELSSHNTWIHQTPAVRVGKRVERGDVLSHSSAIDRGELALGTNLLVAFMPWHGYNFEDAIVLNKRLVSEDVLTSVHINEYEVEARDTKLGPEEITRDIPNVNEKALEGLDEEGIVRVGTRVKPGDILVGKVTLKGGVQYSPEEKLLRAIFGEKSREVRDTSLRVPPGVEGSVVDVKIFSRSGMRKDKRYKAMVLQESERFASEFAMHCSTLERMLIEKVAALVEGKDTPASYKGVGVSGKKFAAVKVLTASLDELRDLRTKDAEINDMITRLLDRYENQRRILTSLHEERLAKLKKGDPLASGVIKMIKVYIAMKRPIQAGDKIAGRHGNKGVISLIVPREDMPYLHDGTPVDVVLNPLGVPSRMNVGQILETILAFNGVINGRAVADAVRKGEYQEIYKRLVAAYGETFVKEYAQTHGEEEILELARETARDGVLYRVPVFDGPDFNGEIRPLLRESGLSETGADVLYNGRTGERFDQTVTVGSIYMMKLDHMVDDKLHARSVGPYSLVTQQPLGGKAQMGGQRLGEMEVWALEAYGAAHILQEMLTYKSDDVSGRHKVYEAIVRGEEVPEPGLPEAFNVMIKELQSLGIRIDLFKSGKEDVGE